MSYVPYQYNNYAPAYYAQPAAPAMKPKTSVDSVRIDIVNPKASMEPAGQVAPMSTYPSNYYVPNYQVPNYPYYPTNYPVYNPNSANTQNIHNTYSPNTTYVNNPNNITPQPTSQPVQQTPVQPQQQPQPQPPVQPQQNQQQAQQPNNKPTMTTDKGAMTPPPAKPEPVQEHAGIPETLIRAIDNALKNSDPQVRINAATKLASTFEKNPAAASDPALTALLNRVLKDPHQNVRLMGEIALKVNATGNDETLHILKGMTNSRDAFGFDSLAANNILLKMAERGNNVAPSAQNPEYESSSINAGVDYAKPLNFVA